MPREGRITKWLGGFLVFIQPSSNIIGDTRIKNCFILLVTI
jgi:hypothetical protein